MKTKKRNKTISERERERLDQRLRARNENEEGKVKRLMGSEIEI
jgi:hypothetical protein